MQRLAFVWLIVVVCTVQVLAQQLQTPSQTDLDAISVRGKLLYEADEAAWHSTDAVQALHPPESSVRGYFPLKTDWGWQVAYGRMNESGDKFLIAYLATQSTTPDKFNVETFTPPKEDSGFYLFAAKVRSVAQKDFGGANRPYNISVLPADAGKFYVYVYPAQTVTAVYPLGGDIRYLIAADGTTIIEKHQMHKSILETDMRNQAKGSAKTVSGFHTHILSDLPEDTDIFHVLTEQPRVPEMIGTAHFIYAVDESGGIRIVDKRKSKK